MLANPSTPRWKLRAMMAAEYPFLARAADASGMKQRFYNGVGHLDQEVGIELWRAVECAGICVPGILRQVNTT